MIRFRKEAIRDAEAVIQEAGLEGFWIHRVLTENGIESQEKRLVRPQAPPGHPAVQPCASEA